MSVVAFPHVTVVGARSRDIESHLAAAGMRSTSVNASELAALAHPSARTSQVLVVDLRDGAGLPAAVALVRRNHPDTAIVLVVSALEPALMLEAMRAGVSEVVPEPLSDHVLEAAICRVYHAAEPDPGGKVLAVVGSKGGVGATTVAANIATTLAQESPGQSLLIDLHLAQGDAGLLLGADVRHSIVDALENTHRLDEAYFRGLVAQPKRGAHVLASSERHVIGAPGADRVRAVVQFASRWYAYVVLDVPRSDLTTLDGLDSATRILVIVNQELSAIRNATSLVDTLGQRYGRERLSLALVRYDKGAEIATEDVEKVIGIPVSHIVPNDYRAAVRAVNQGQPLVTQDGHKVGAALKALARDLAGLRDPKAETPPASGLLGRLTLRRSQAL